MIVVMAAGNTPTLDWNVFSGLRALSVISPSSCPGGSRRHLYRMLFSPPSSCSR